MPAGGWPAVVVLPRPRRQPRRHGDDRRSRWGSPASSYVVLTPDARGHGDSGGLIGIDGPKRGRATSRALYAWLARPARHRPTTGSAPGGSRYGGGAVWNSLVAGVPWDDDRGGRDVDEPRAARSRRRGSSSRASSRGFTGRDRRRDGCDPDGRRDPRCRLRRADLEPSCRGSPRARRSQQLDGRHDSRLHDAGPPRLRVRYRPGVAGLGALNGPEAPVDRPPRARAVDLPGGPTPPSCSREAAKWFDTYLRGEPGGLDQAKPGRGRPRALAAAHPFATPAFRSASPRGSRCPGKTAIGLTGKVTAVDRPRSPDLCGDVRRTDREGDGNGDQRLDAARRRAERAHTGGQGDRRRRAVACRTTPGTRTYTIYALEPGDGDPARLEADAHVRLVLARPEPGEPALSRPAVRARRRS